MTWHSCSLVRVSAEVMGGMKDIRSIVNDLGDVDLDVNAKRDVDTEGLTTLIEGSDDGL